MARSLLVLSAAAGLAAAAPAAAQQAGGATQLEEIQVEGQGSARTSGDGAAGVVSNDGYVAKTTRTATKTETPVHEAPATINTVTQKQIADRNPQNLQEALYYTPGVRSGAFGFDPRFDSFFIRGVDVTYTGVFRDGLRQFSSPSGLFRLEPYGLEAISILKGPSSALYGAGASVGVIDLISKRPTDYRFGEVEVQTGSFDRKQVNFDIGGPLNEQGTVLYRLTALARDANTEMERVPDDRVFIAPAVTFRPSDATEITVLSEFLRGKTGGSAAFVNAYDASFNPTGATRTPLANGDFNDFTQDQGRIGYEFKHAFSDSVSLHQNARFSALSQREEYNGRYDTVSEAGGAGLVKEQFAALAADTYLKTDFRTGELAHTLLTGVDISLLKYSSKYALSSYDDPNAIPTPDFGSLAATPSRARQDQSLIGVYAQDELKWNAWRLTLNARYDWFDSIYKSNDVVANYNADGTIGGYDRVKDTQRQNDGKFTGRAGLSYVTAFGLTPYVGYGTSFVPNPGTVIDGTVTRPTLGEQVEAGVKYKFPDVNATINASVFNLRQDDGVVYAVVGTENRQTQLDFRSRGFEIDGAATFENGVSLQASYAYTDTKIAKPDSIKGKELTSTPKHSFSLWGGYDVQNGAAKGLSLGAGVRYTGRNFGDNDNRAVIANTARAFVDAKIAYELENLTPKLKGVKLQVNATNLLDKVEQVCSSNYCYWDEGRKVIASLKYRW
ncbi:ligand-gated channel [Methylopila jiangsuensis]|uniref:Ligand-gated channel n=1 Tax=Methylopila jiangsuensis TaxID=586230 RepID=A0A9W6JIE6_9HYPH|nr:TonB-dependent siderophore receptor [Methylopila jiangsuensis]MDR6284390.1 iron complex outermembrane receptor protein [Methylopila jiangsuensis]GLK78225.1 ligand-gated channel [Methylopila jiangsuensis]